MSGGTRACWASVLATAVVVSGCSESPSVQETTTSVVDASERAVDGSRAEDAQVAAAPALDKAAVALATLEVKGRAPKTGYERAAFGAAWTDDNTAMWGANSLRTREDILSRDLLDITCKNRPSMPSAPPCVVQSGVLKDPYTGTVVDFTRGNKTSTEVPIDHVVSLSDAWQKGAQQLSEAERVNLANDPLNLVATTRAPNSAKRDGDAATWLVPNKAFRCTYVARQIAVKVRYRLWVTQAEHEAMENVLSSCPDQPVPTDKEAAVRTE